MPSEALPQTDTNLHRRAAEARSSAQRNHYQTAFSTAWYALDRIPVAITALDSSRSSVRTLRSAITQLTCTSPQDANRVVALGAIRDSKKIISARPDSAAPD